VDFLMLCMLAATRVALILFELGLLPTKTSMAAFLDRAPVRIEQAGVCQIILDKPDALLRSLVASALSAKEI
jgi:hypothetical protein